MKHESKHRPEESGQLSHSASHQTNQREFASTEELLQHDAAHTEVPPVIAERLTNSIKALPQPKPSWWQRWLKR